jgi:outer membrane protein assembly factor BamB/predicted phosphodiesterase
MYYNFLLFMRSYCKLFFLIFLSIMAESNIVFGQKAVSFALLADLHVNPGSKSDTSLQLIVKDINSSNVDFIIVAGDISNSGTDNELQSVKKALDKLVKPYYILPGNHETNWSESAGLTYTRLWGEDHFVFTCNGYLLVGFDTGPYMKMGDGFVRQEDILWLRRELKKQQADNKILISFSHYPLSDGLDNWTEVTEILKSFDCRVAFCGHGHRLTLMNFNGIPGIMGRTSLPGSSSGPGYNLVTLHDDTVQMYNKELSGLSEKPALVLNYMKPDTLSKIAISQIPDYSINQNFYNRTVVAGFSDTASIFSGPCLVDDTLLVYGNSLGYIKAIGTLSKKIRWQRKVEGPVYSTPVASEGIVVVGTVDGNIIGLNAVDGRQLWEVSTGKPVLAEGVIENGSVFIGGGNPDFYRINLRNGKIIWQYEGIKGLIQGKPALSGTSVIFGAWDTYLYCLDKNNGSLRWKWNNGNSQKLYSSGNVFPVCSGSNVFIVAPDRFMTALDIATGKEIWRTNRHQVRESMGISPDGSLVYAKLMNDTVIAVSASERYPKTIWKVNAGFGYEHNPCPVAATGKTVLAATRDGMLVAIDSELKRVLWKYKAGNSSVNKIVPDKDNTFWITLAEGKIIGIKSIEN